VMVIVVCLAGNILHFIANSEKYQVFGILSVALICTSGNLHFSCLMLSMLDDGLEWVNKWPSSVTPPPLELDKVHMFPCCLNKCVKENPTYFRFCNCIRFQVADFNISCKYWCPNCKTYEI
jgi:hypothetical protein